MSKRIAIIGSGISGLTCAYLLHKKFDITLYESGDYIGGHTATKQVTVNGQNYAIDTGFIVYNDWTYPNFIKLMEQLGVATQPTEMSFSVSNRPRNFEYNGHNLDTLFAQRRNILRPGFYRLLADIVKFNRLCKNEKITNAQLDLTLGEFIQQHKLSESFAENYILPMCAAIWSTSLEGAKGFPLKFFLRFFNNHGLLNIANRPQWHTIIGGSAQYIAPITAGFRDKILLNSPVESVARHSGQYLVTAKGQDPSLFDEVIFACHSDQALNMLAAPTEQQQTILGALTYADNDVVLHTDTSVLPSHRKAWASWNYLIKGFDGEHMAPASVTYNMNILQCLDAPVTFCVTLNNSQEIAAEKILGRYTYAHPQVTEASVLAQQQRKHICGVRGLHFCGAYWYNGFHEDGVRSALDVCTRFGVSL